MGCRGRVEIATRLILDGAERLPTHKGGTRRWIRSIRPTIDWSEGMSQLFELGRLRRDNHIYLKWPTIGESVSVVSF